MPVVTIHSLSQYKLSKEYLESNTPPSVIIYGPMGCGKTTNAEKLANQFGLKIVFEDLQKHHVRGVDLPRGILFLTNMVYDQLRHIVKGGLSLFSYEDAMRRINGTPSAQWRVNGEPDPHGSAYDCERATLTLGKLTDDELANAAFMNYDHFPNPQDIISGKAHSPIAYMTGVKDRIRWLSRKNEALISELETLRKQLADSEANHKDMVDRNAILRQREDLPADRIPAYERLVALQEENVALKKILNSAGQDRLGTEEVLYPREVFGQLITKNSPYAFYIFQWVPYQTEAKQRRLKMLHDVKHFDGREEHGIWPNGNHCGSFKDDEVEFIRISRNQFGHEWQDPRDRPDENAKHVVGVLVDDDMPVSERVFLSANMPDPERTTKAQKKRARKLETQRKLQIGNKNELS